MNWYNKFIGRLLAVLLLTISVLFTGASCSEKSDQESSEEQNLENNFSITGTILGAANQPVILEALSAKGTIKLAETMTEVNGDFELVGNIKGMGLYQLSVGIAGNKSIPITLSPKEKIKVNGSYANFERLVDIKGAKWGPVVSEYMRIFNDFAVQQMALVNDPKLSEEQKLQEFLKLRRPLDEFAKQQMLKDLSNPANIVLTTSMTPAMGFEQWDASNLEVLKSVAKAFQKKYPSSPITKSMAVQVEQIEAGYNQFINGGSSPVISNVAPEISLPNPDGKVISLSSLKGKVVLIDFWASWCGPCRKENPNVVAMYSKYKDKGFTVFSVSLDNDKEAWKRAIKSDGLVWPNHVSDLKQWETPLVQLYQFEGIPFTVLIDKKGNIIAKNLRGQALESKLKEIL
jgi:thiol-disulfide isomerase/thioredoxin